MLTIENRYLKISLLTIFATLFIVYWPAISGPFLFDDHYNLASLQNNGGVTTFQNWLDFVFGGGSSFLGRPLALASFTLNAQTWPANVEPFKITNIVIHCLNGWLVYILLEKIRHIYNDKKSFKVSQLLSIIGTAIWLFHPIHLTTILQVVQRMTLLSGTFILISLIGYTSFVARHTLRLDKPFVKILLFLAIFGILGILSKETAFITPFLIFALNLTIFKSRLNESQQFYRIWQCGLLIGPLVIFALGTLYLESQLEALWKIREFNLIERLLTESRILLQYLTHIFVPQTSGAGLFHDDIFISSGLFSPFTTVLSVTGIVGLMLLAIYIRHSLPFASLAIFWFFLGHIFESTIWPLELYFEHRNYIPSLCIVFALIQGHLFFKNRSNKLFYLGSSVYFLLTLSITTITTPIWGDKILLFTKWAEEKPSSIRAQHNAAHSWLNEYNDPVSARRFLMTAFQNHPKSLGTRMRLIENYCYFSQADKDIYKFVENIEDLKSDTLYLPALSAIAHLKENNHCKSLPTEFVIEVINRLETNAGLVNSSGSWLFYNKSRLLLIVEDYSKALLYAERASKVTPYLSTSILKLRAAEKLADREAFQKYILEAAALEAQHLHFLRPDEVKLYQELKKQQ